MQTLGSGVLFITHSYLQDILRYENMTCIYRTHFTRNLKTDVVKRTLKVNNVVIPEYRSFSYDY